MGLDATWRRRSGVLRVWLENGGDLNIASYAGETIAQAMNDWITEAKKTIQDPNVPNLEFPEEDMVKAVLGDEG